MPVVGRSNGQAVDHWAVRVSWRSVRADRHGRRSVVGWFGRAGTGPAVGRIGRVVLRAGLGGAAGEVAQSSGRPVQRWTGLDRVRRSA
jgi:hypothetical protein